MIKMKNKVISISKGKQDLQHKEILLIILDNYKESKEGNKDFEEVIDELKREVEELYEGRENYLFVVDSD